jgi:glycosyltransferase involved in cell wall biosynthesis
MWSIAPGTDARGNVQPLALLLPTLENGGAERAVSVLAGALAARGEPVDLVVGSVGRHGHALVPPGVRLVELGTRRVLTSFRALQRYLVREQPAALLVNLTHANAMALITRLHPGSPDVRIVAVEHSTLSGFARHSGAARHRLLPLAARATYRHADALVTVSRGARADLARIVGLPEDRIELIGNAIPAAELRRLADEPPEHPWLAPASAPFMLALGNLRPVKGFPSLLHAFAAVRERRKARLIILGEGPQRSRLEDLVRRLGLEDDVQLPGSVANPYPWIARAAGVVLTSGSEGLPTVLLEAMLLGRPIVAVDCPSGPREILADGRLGRLVAPGDAPALVDGIAWALDAGPMPVPQDVVDAHDPDRVASRYLELLRPGYAPRAEPAVTAEPVITEERFVTAEPVIT